MIILINLILCLHAAPKPIGYTEALQGAYQSTSPFSTPTHQVHSPELERNDQANSSELRSDDIGVPFELEPNDRSESSNFEPVITDLSGMTIKSLEEYVQETQISERKKEKYLSDISKMKLIVRGKSHLKDKNSSYIFFSKGIIGDRMILSQETTHVCFKVDSNIGESLEIIKLDNASGNKTVDVNQFFKSYSTNKEFRDSIDVQIIQLDSDDIVKRYTEVRSYSFYHKLKIENLSYKPVKSLEEIVQETQIFKLIGEAKIKNTLSNQDNKDDLIRKENFYMTFDGVILLAINKDEIGDRMILPHETDYVIFEVYYSTKLKGYNLIRANSLGTENFDLDEFLNLYFNGEIFEDIMSVQAMKLD